jgi:hypothetical protein
MINFKKGPALSLHQVNYVAAPGSGVTGIEAGHVVRIQADGLVYKGASSATVSQWNDVAVYGFAINNQTAGDVIESGKIGVYALDGSSVIETDQTTDTINSSNYPIGALLGAATDSSGTLTKVANTYAGKIVGQVEGIRTLPGSVQTLTDNNGNAFKVQGTTTVLAVKLLS